MFFFCGEGSVNIVSSFVLPVINAYVKIMSKCCYLRSTVINSETEHFLSLNFLLLLGMLYKLLYENLLNVDYFCGQAW